MSRLEDTLNRQTEEPRNPLPSEAATEPPALSASPEAETPAIPFIKGTAFLSSVYTNIQLAVPDAKCPTIAVCSSVTREGVTTIICSLAEYVALKKKTLLIDFNLLSPQIHRHYKMECPTGLMDVLYGRGSLDECVIRTHMPMLDILPIGGASISPVHIIGSPVIPKILKEAKSRYEMVLLDCPPLRILPDSSLLAAECDGVALVVRARRTKREIILHTRELLSRAGAKEIGVILNRVKYYIPEFIYRWL